MFSSQSHAFRSRLTRAQIPPIVTEKTSTSRSSSLTSQRQSSYTHVRHPASNNHLPLRLQVVVHIPPNRTSTYRDTLSVTAQHRLTHLDQIHRQAPIRVAEPGTPRVAASLDGEVAACLDHRPEHERNIFVASRLNATEGGQLGLLGIPDAIVAGVADEELAGEGRRESGAGAGAW